MMQFAKRIRPGSRGAAPISTTLGKSRQQRTEPREGMSRPGSAQTVEGTSYPVVIVTEMDNTGRETRRSIGAGIRQLLGVEKPTHENITEEDSTGFGRYEPDDRAVVGKLFGIYLDDD